MTYWKMTSDEIDYMVKVIDSEGNGSFLSDFYESPIVKAWKANHSKITAYD